MILVTGATGEFGKHAVFSVAQANGELEMSDNSLEKLLGRKPTTSTEFLTKIYV